MTIESLPRWRTALMLSLAGGVCAIGLVIAGANAQGVSRRPTTQPATSQPASAADSHALLVQRCDAYRRIERIVEGQVHQGSASPTALHEARLDRLESELEIAETEREYERLQHAILEELHGEESRVIAAAAAGRASEVDVLRAKINRLDAQIELAWEAEEDDHEYEDEE